MTREKKPADETPAAGSETHAEEMDAAAFIAKFGKAEWTRIQLAKQPKVSVLVPLEQGEKDGTVHIVTINGYRYFIPKNTVVEVPKQVADMIAESHRLTLAAGKAFRLDRSPDVEQALS